MSGFRVWGHRSEVGSLCAKACWRSSCAGSNSEGKQLDTPALDSQRVGSSDTISAHKHVLKLSQLPSSPPPARITSCAADSGCSHSPSCSRFLDLTAARSCKGAHPRQDHHTHTEVSQQPTATVAVTGLSLQRLPGCRCFSVLQNTTKQTATSYNQCRTTRTLSAAPLRLLTCDSTTRTAASSSPDTGGRPPIHTASSGCCCSCCCSDCCF